MLIIQLQRKESTDQGTFGRLTIGQFSCYTGELPWRDNQRGISCIPAGSYKVGWVFASEWRGGRWVYLLQDVPSRSSVLMHSGNYCGDKALGYRTHVQGCILLGEKLGWIDGQKAILLSTPMVRQFEQLMGGKLFTLEIHDA